jgi:autotransporter-associated beta strand protein
MAMESGNCGRLTRPHRLTAEQERLPKANFAVKASLTRLARFAAAAIILAVMLGATSAHAQFVWSGASTDYNTTTNWSPTAGAPPANVGDTAQFGATGSTTVNVSAGPITPDSWTFTAASQNYTVTGAAVNFNGAGPNLVNAGGTNSIFNNMNGEGISVTGGSLTLSGANGFATATVSAGTLKAGSASAIGSTNAMTVGTAGTTATLDLGGFNISIGSLAGNATGVVTNSGGAAAVLTTGADNSSTTFAGTIQDGASTMGLTKIALGTLTLSGNNTYTGNTTITFGTLALSGSGSIAASNLVMLEGTLDISGTTSGASLVALGSTGSSGVVTLGSKTLTITNGTSAVQFHGTINGSGGLTIAGGVEDLYGINGYTGVTTINSGAILGILGTGSIASSSKVVANGSFDISVASGGTSITSLAGTNSSANVQLGSNTLTITNAANDSFAGAIHGTGGLTLNGGGYQLLSGTSDYTGATTVNGGILAVVGSIVSAVTVNNGGYLTGTGQVGAAQIDAGASLAPGTLVPGQSMTLASLAFQSGAFYLVGVNPATASFANVTGNATLGGATVLASFASGSYVAKQYTIMNAGNIIGKFNPTVSSNGLPSGFTTSLSYDGTHAYLNLALSLTSPSFTGLSGNRQNVANTLTNFFNSTGGIPMVFGSLTPAGLTQVSGESATASQQTTFDAMGQFMGVMTDPFVAGRADGASAGGAPTAYAEENLAGAGRGRTGSERDAYAAIYRKAAPVASFEQRWSVWAAGYGGSQTTNGDPRVLGSNDTRSSIYGTAVGADYRFSPDTIAGFALAGGGTNFSVNTLGSGRSDLFQAGAFVRHDMGPAYITAALAYGWQDVTTNRTVTAAGIDQLRAEFNANAWSGRLESGYRFVAPVAGGIGVTPYAAGQFTSFDLPSYMEQATVGSNQFALAYNSKSVTDTRSELGFRTDKSFAIEGGIFTLRGRLAWAHDFDPDRSLLATFQTLPGASFVVNGAQQSADSALTTASAEWKWINGWSAAATFEGEFSSVTTSYAGKGVVRYAW